MSQRWLSLVQIAVPALLAILAKYTIVLSRDRRARHRIRENAELLEALPEASRPALAAVVDAQVRRFSDEQMRQTGRQIDAGNLILAIFVIVVGAVILWAGLAIGHWWSITIGCSIGGAILIFGSVGGLGNLYKELEIDDATTPDRPASGE